MKNTSKQHHKEAYRLVKTHLKNYQKIFGKNAEMWYAKNFMFCYHILALLNFFSVFFGEGKT